MRAWLGILTVVCIVIAPRLSAAQNEETIKDELSDEFALLAEEEIVYSAAKHKQEITESPSAITVITREQIENTHCTDVICLLRQVAEVDVRRVTPSFPVVTDSLWQRTQATANGLFTSSFSSWASDP